MSIVDVDNVIMTNLCYVMTVSAGLESWFGLEYLETIGYILFIQRALNARRYRKQILTPHVTPYMMANGGRFPDNARTHNTLVTLMWPASLPIVFFLDHLDKKIRR